MKQLAIPKNGKTWLAVKVVPGASRNRVTGLHGDRLKVTVAAPPEKGKANKAVLDVLRDLFQLQPRQLRIVQGDHQPMKTVELDMTVDELLNHLQQQGWIESESE